jgi:hypothetical protein
VAIFDYLPINVLELSEFQRKDKHIRCITVFGYLSRFLEEHSQSDLVLRIADNLIRLNSIHLSIRSIKDVK